MPIQRELLAHFDDKFRINGGGVDLLVERTNRRAEMARAGCRLKDFHCRARGLMPGTPNSTRNFDFAAARLRLTNVIL